MVGITQIYEAIYQDISQMCNLQKMTDPVRTPLEKAFAFKLPSSPLGGQKKLRLLELSTLYSLVEINYL